MTHVIVSGLEGGDRNDLPPLLLRPGVMVADDTLHPVNSRKLDMMTDSEMLLPRSVARSPR